MKIQAQIKLPPPPRLVGELAKQTRFALKTALNTTATQVRDGLRSEIQRTIDRPTPYTLNSLFIRAATNQNLEATVWLKDERATSNAGTPATRYMLPHIVGGQRTLKRFERALQITGQMPKGWYAVPGAGAPRACLRTKTQGPEKQLQRHVGGPNDAGDPPNQYTG